MEKLIFAALIVAAAASTAFAAEVLGSGQTVSPPEVAASASEQSQPRSSKAAKVKRDASGRMILEPLKASDFARRAPSPEVAAPASELSQPGPSKAGKVKRDASGRMMLEPMKASDFTHLNKSSK